MSREQPRKLKVAAIQLESKNGEIEANLAKAIPFVERAAASGASLIVLPEFYPTGYVFTRAIWDAAEPRDGQTLSWLKKHSSRLGVFLGTSFLEAEGEHFFNTFVLTTPEGTVAGHVRKQTPAAFEAYFTHGDAGPHVIHTSLGRIGVGICYENQLTYTSELMIAGEIDLMLMPHSAPRPSASIFFPKKAVEVYVDRLRTIGQTYAEALGVPTVVINKCGPWQTSLPGLPFLTQNSHFPGFSSIIDCDGATKAQLQGEAGLLVEEVTLDPSRKKSMPLSCRGRWAIDLPFAVNFFRVVERTGSLWYGLSAERKRRALEVSGGAAIGATLAT